MATKEQEAAAAAEKAAAEQKAKDVAAQKAAAEKAVQDAAEIARLQQELDELEAAQEAAPPVRVKAKRPGFYDNGRKRVGDEFTIPAGEKPGSWMEVLDEQADGTK